MRRISSRPCSGGRGCGLPALKKSPFGRAGPRKPSFSPGPIDSRTANMAPICSRLRNRRERADRTSLRPQGRPNRTRYLMNALPPVPLADPRRDLARYEADLIEATRRVIGSGSYIGGPELDRFETAMAQSTGVDAAVGVGSGTDALIFALQAAGIGRGDEVIVPSHTAGPSVAAIHALFATPVFVDVDYDTACIDTALV